MRTVLEFPGRRSVLPGNPDPSLMKPSEIEPSTKTLPVARTVTAAGAPSNRQVESSSAFRFRSPLRCNSIPGCNSYWTRPSGLSLPWITPAAAPT